MLRRASDLRATGGVHCGAMESWKRAAVDATFGMGSATRLADLEAWIARGDDAAFARLAGRASKRQKDWRSLGLVGDDPADASLVERALPLARSARSDAEIAEWLTGHGSELWVLAFHRAWSAEHGGAAVEAKADGWPHERRTAALVALFRALPRDGDVLAGGFRGLARGSGPAVAWSILEKLEAEARIDGDHWRVARRFGPAVGVSERSKKTALHVLESPAAAEAFVASLPPLEVNVKGEYLDSVPGVVSIWIDAELDPMGTLDGKGGPIGLFDHDDWETARGEPAVAIRQFSYADGFADAAIARATEWGLTASARIDALYGRRLLGPPGKRQYGWYLGAFPYHP